jgi:hypothetical protein
MASAAPLEILRLLSAERVDFIVVGMAAGILRGAPLTTLDLDIVHQRSLDNVRRLLAVLRNLQAIYRRDPRRLEPQESHLVSPGHSLLETLHGDLDCLGTVGNGRTYEDLLDRAPAVQLEENVRVRVIDLPTLIELKQEAGRPKDIAVLPVLRATLAETLRRA